MAAVAKAKKKVVNQQELRRLMREKQRAAAGGRRIESPLAKYNSLGHLSCVVCSIPIKNELLWQTHILGKQHKENLEKRRNTYQMTGALTINTPAVPLVKRKGTDTETKAAKKVKASCDSRTSTSTGLPADFIDPINETSVQHSSQSLVTGSDDDMEEKAENNADPAPPMGVAVVQKNAALPAPVQNQTENILPADFFDSGLKSSAVSHSGSIQKPERPDKTVERKENTAEALPEGFFDDPVKDARVRKVDPPKDQMDKEWDEFQKEIRQINTVSEAIVAENDEEVRLDRQIEEIDEQIMCYRRVEHLRDRQESVKQLLTTSQDRQSQGDEKVDTDEEEELQEFLSGDWRAKGALL